MCLSLDRLHVCTLFTDLQHYKFLLSRRLLETICWLSTFAKTLKANRVMMSATHLENSVLLGPYLSVSISAYPSHIASVSTPNDTRTCLGWTVLYTRVWERSNYNPGETSLGQYSKYFFNVSLLLLKKDTILFYEDGQRKSQVF